MDSTLDEISAKCARQLRLYQQCVSANREDWGRKCNVQRRELSDCAEQNVQVLGKIKRECQKSIDDYDKCLAQNKSNPSKCIANLRNLTICVDAAAKREGIAIPRRQGL